MNKLLAILFFIFSLACSAQNTSPAMADSLREDGKIYVVIGVILLIFVCIIGFLIFIERKISKIEKSESGKKDQ